MKALDRLVRRSLDVIGRVARRRLNRRAQRGHAPNGGQGAQQGSNPHADERTIRLIATAQGGGMTSEQGKTRYSRGEHHFGLHGGAQNREGMNSHSTEDLLEDEVERLERRKSRGASRPEHRKGA